MTRFLNIAMLSIHSSPLGRVGTADTGGMSVYLLELSTELGKKGHHVDIFTRRTAQAGQQFVEIAPHVRIIHIAAEGTEHLQRSELYVHLQRFCTAIDAFAKQAENVYDLLHSNYWLSGVVGEWLKRRWRCPHVITFHTLAAAKMAALRGHHEDENRISEENRMLQTCDRIIVPTVEEANYCASVHSNKVKSVCHIPLGVNIDRFTTTDQEVVEISPDAPVKAPLLLYVGRFDPMKGLDLALRSLHLLADRHGVHLAIVGGDGVESVSYKRIKQLLNELGIAARVHLLGSVDHSRMGMYYRRADAVVVPSLYESFGLVILEALACGTPVAATAVGIGPFIIKPGKNGYLAAPGDELSLANAIINTLALAKHLNCNTIRESVSDYSWARVANLTVDVYNGMISNKK